MGSKNHQHIGGLLLLYQHDHHRHNFRGISFLTHPPPWAFLLTESSMVISRESSNERRRTIEPPVIFYLKWSKLRVKRCQHLSIDIKFQNMVVYGCLHKKIHRLVDWDYSTQTVHSYGQGALLLCDFNPPYHYSIIGHWGLWVQKSTNRHFIEHGQT